MDKTKPIDATQLEDLKQLYAEAVAISPLPWTRKGDEFDDWGMIRGTKTEENPLGNMPIASTVNEAHFGDWRDAMYAKTKGRVLEGEESAAYDAEWKAGPPQAIALAEAIVQIMNAFPTMAAVAHVEDWSSELPTEPGAYWLASKDDDGVDEVVFAKVLLHNFASGIKLAAFIEDCYYTLENVHGQWQKARVPQHPPAMLP